MLLKVLTLRNYRKYRDVCIEFPDGVIGIIGLNGVGKTTLVEAIGWALFGHHAARTTKELIKREGASPHEPCQVGLEFELEGDNYRVVREMSGKNLMPKARLVINGRLITSNAEEVTRVLEERLGMDYQSFFTSIFARQKELNALSSMKAAERKKLMLRMLGIERIERSIQAIREDKRGKEKKIEGIKTAIFDKDGRKKIEVFRTKLKELDKAKEALLPLIAGIEADTERKKRVVLATKRQLELETGKYERYVELSNTLGGRRSDLENTRKRRDEREKELAALIDKKKRLEAIEPEERRYFELKTRKEELERLKELNQRRMELNKRKEKTLREITHRTGVIRNLRQGLTEYKDVEEELETHMRLRTELERLKELNQRKDELLKRKERAMQEVKSRESEIVQRKAERRLFEADEARLETVKNEIEVLRHDKESLHSAIGAYKAEIQQIKRDMKANRDKLAKIEALGPEGECPMCERQLGTHYDVLIEKLKDELRSSEEKLYTAFNEYKNKKQELVAKDNAERRLAERLKELEKRVNRKRELDTEIEQGVRELNVWRAELKEVLMDLKPLEEVEFDNNQYKAVVERISELEKRVRAKNELEVKISHEERELARWQEELEHIMSDLKPVADVVFDVKDYNTVVRDLEAVERVYHEIISLRAEIKRTDMVKADIQKLRDEERRIVAEIAELRKQVEALAFDKMAYVELKSRYERESEELNELKLELVGKRNELDSLDREKERVKADIEEQKRLMEEKEREEEDIMYLNLLEKIMSDFKVYMVGMIRPMLSDYASEMLRRLTDGKYSKLELDEDYNIYIYEDGTAYELNRFSGGEEDLANLCLRLAISAVVAERSAIQTHFIILDEIFGSQDMLRKRNIITALSELSKKFRQIFLITHIEDIKDYMEYVLRVSEDEEGVSWVSMERG